MATDVIAQLGESHYGRRKLQPPPRVVDEFYARAEAVLKFPLLEFGSREVVPIGGALSEAIGEHRYTCYACAIMPDHVHLIVRRHKHKAEEMIDNLQEASRLRLSRLGLRQVDHPVWVEGGWKGFLDHPDAIRRTIRYIETGSMPPPPTPEERLRHLLKFARSLADLKGEYVACREIRKFVKWYTKGMPQAKEMRQAAVQVKSLEELENIVKSYIEIAPL